MLLMKFEARNSCVVTLCTSAPQPSQDYRPYPRPLGTDPHSPSAGGRHFLAACRCGAVLRAASASAALAAGRR